MLIFLHYIVTGNKQSQLTPNSGPCLPCQHQSQSHFPFQPSKIWIIEYKGKSHSISPPQVPILRSSAQLAKAADSKPAQRWKGKKNVPFWRELIAGRVEI